MYIMVDIFQCSKIDLEVYSFKNFCGATLVFSVDFKENEPNKNCGVKCHIYIQRIRTLLQYKIKNASEIIMQIFPLSFTINVNMNIKI